MYKYIGLYICYFSLQLQHDPMLLIIVINIVINIIIVIIIIISTFILVFLCATRSVVLIASVFGLGSDELCAFLVECWCVYPPPDDDQCLQNNDGRLSSLHPGWSCVLERRVKGREREKLKRSDCFIKRQK